jgi:TonB family protein
LGIKDYSVDHPLRYQAYLACLKSFTKTDIDPKRKQRDFEPIEVRTLVEEMPKFPGGDPAFLKLLREKTSPYKGASGVVYVSYVVDQVGQIRNVKVLRGLSTETDSLATHIIKNLTGYKPGYEAGIPVPVQFTIPIRFE